MQNDNAKCKNYPDTSRDTKILHFDICILNFNLSLCYNTPI